MFLPYRLTKRTPINRIPSNKPFPLEWLHQHLSEIVDIWCIKEETFDINWIKDDTLRAIISQNKGFQANIINIHDYIRNLPVITDKSALRKQLKDAFLINNQIEKLCKGKLKPILYDDLQLPTAQKNALKDGICTYLYESLQKTTAYTDNYETFKAYFDRIIKESKITVCPFCGLERLKSQYDNGRNAFDHYFAKSEYPFTAINTDNTFPICDECNSTENKGSNKVLFDEKNQRKKVFFPFQSYPSVELRVELRNKSKFDEYGLNTSDFIVQIAVQNHSEEVESWERIFKIQSRFQAKMCQELENWTKKLKNTYRRYGRQYENSNAFILSQLENWQDEPMQDRRFLKRALFDCLHRNQILERILVAE